jgi:hypothetical protein
MVCPTALHIVEVAQDTLTRKLELYAGGGVDATDQFVPSQDSTSGINRPDEGTWMYPTATHWIEAVQDTLLKLLLSPAKTGADTTDQVVPSQVSTRSWYVLAVFKEVPTATQSTELTHDTLVRLLPMLLGLGLGTTDQTVPFQDSVNVVDVVVPEDVPTAMQKIELGQDTPSSRPELASWAPAVGVRLGTERPRPIAPNTRKAMAAHDPVQVVRER